MNVPRSRAMSIVLTVCILTWVIALGSYGYSISEFQQLEQEFGADADYSGEVLLDVYSQRHTIVFLLPVASMLIGIRMMNKKEITPLPLACFTCASFLASFLWVVFAIRVIHLGSMREFYWL